MAVDLAQFPIPEIKDSVSSFTGKLHDGFVALSAGDVPRANDCLNDYLAGNPESADVLLLKGVVEARTGNVESAISFISKSIQVKSENSGGYLAMGLLQQATSNHVQAAACLSDAELFGNTTANAHFNESIGLIPVEQAKEMLNRRCYAFIQRNNINAALSSALTLLQLDGDGAVSWNTFSEVLRYARFGQPVIDLLRAQIIKGLQRDDINHYGMVFATISALCFEPGLDGICSTTIETTEAQTKLKQQMQNGSLKQIVGNEMFNVLMNRTLIPDQHFEFWLTAFRSLITQLAAEDKILTLTDEVYEEFICNLSHQCFRTEYVYFETEEDKANLAKLENNIRTSLANEEPISAVQIAILSLFKPLNDYDFTDELLEFEWADNLQKIISVQVDDLREEREIRGEIKQLTSISAEVSKLVRGQYEENPFPRWGSPPAEAVRKPLKALVLDAFPHVDSNSLVDSDNPEVLVAGCGTGWIPMSLAMSIKNPNITAVDLSLSSISYGARKARQQGVTNIQFGQADILNLRELGKEFDHINCYGVLHHMENIIDGFHVLADILKPGGTMHLGLYSKVARKINWMGRDYIAEKNYQGTSDDMRQFRQDLYRMPKDGLMARSALNWGFFMISDVRDMFFHVQEICITLPELKVMIAEVGLEFLGFEIQQPQVPQQYREKFPDDQNLLSLDHWHEFEQDYPGTFSETYNFWLKKPI